MPCKNMNNNKTTKKKFTQSIKDTHPTLQTIRATKKMKKILAKSE
jgi:hypothetical protein